MKRYLFGYGSLINLESASRTLKRVLSKNDVFITRLNQFQRNWLLWDNVFSEHLQKEVKGVFLNVSVSKEEYLNGLIFELSDEELGYFKLREKNYDCLDVTELVEIENFNYNVKFKVFTFAGKPDCLLNNSENSFIFERYIQIVNSGVTQFGDDFKKEFEKTTVLNNLPKIEGPYSFVDNKQQQAR
jgi:hypothetical protein